jgi:hypothetical protein
MRPLGKGKMNSEHNYPSYFQKFSNLEDDILFRGRFCNTSNPKKKQFNLIHSYIYIIG